MGYLERHSQANRGGMMIAAAALNGAVILGLVTAFGGIPLVKLVDPHVGTWNEPETRVPLDPPKHEPKPQVGRPLHVDDKPKDVVVDFKLGFDPGPLPPFDPPGGGGTIIERPQPPVFTPKPAVALGDPGGWATEADFPGAELRAGHAGTTRFHLSIGTDGRVSACSVTVSSGWPGLDEATCRLVSARARFRPATDGTGAATMGTFSSAIRWVIPS